MKILKKILIFVLLFFVLLNVYALYDHKKEDNNTKLERLLKKVGMDDIEGKINVVNYIHNYIFFDQGYMLFILDKFPEQKEIVDYKKIKSLYNNESRYEDAIILTEEIITHIDNSKDIRYLEFVLIDFNVNSSIVERIIYKDTNKGIYYVFLKCSNRFFYWV